MRRLDHNFFTNLHQQKQQQQQQQQNISNISFHNTPLNNNNNSSINNNGPSDIVPVTGLIVNRLHRLENELKTVFDHWRGRMPLQ